MKVIYMHGIGDHPAPEVLKSDWDRALFGKDMGTTTAFAYWADLRPDTTAFDALDILTASPSAVTSSLELTDSLFETVAAEIMQDVAANVSYVNQLSTSSPDKAIPAIPGPVADAILKLLIKDVAIYFFMPEVRKKIQQRLLDCLNAVQDCIVIGHSMGTVITYDVLRTYAPQPGFSQKLYITMGSPLGLPTVQRNLKKLAGKADTDTLPAPSHPPVWSNFASVADPVALDPTLHDEFSVSAGQRLDDYNVWNPDLFKLNPHSGTGYLSTNEVKAQVRMLVSSVAGTGK